MAEVYDGLAWEKTRDTFIVEFGPTDRASRVLTLISPQAPLVAHLVTRAIKNLDRHDDRLAGIRAQQQARGLPSSASTPITPLLPAAALPPPAASSTSRLASQPAGQRLSGLMGVPVRTSREPSTGSNPPARPPGRAESITVSAPPTPSGARGPGVRTSQLARQI